MPLFVRCVVQQSIMGESRLFFRMHCQTLHRKPLSFHTVSFGPHNETLRRMAQVAREVEATAPRDPLLPPDAHVESSYATALDSVRFDHVFYIPKLTRSRFDWRKHSWDWLIL